MTLTVTEHSDVNRPRHRAALLSLLILIGALVTYKTATALRVIERVKAGGALPATSVTAGLDVVSRAIDYLAVIWPALLFGILISAAVRTFISPESLVRLFGHTARRAQLTGGLAGSPLMLCSCCVAPIFSTVYRDSSRLAPSLALMLSAPSLNPAALVLTFMLFAGTVAWARLLPALVAVLFGTLFIARFVPSASGGTAQHLHHLHGRHHASSARPTFLQSCVHVIVRAVPPIAVGVLAGMFVAEHLSTAGFVAWDARLITIAVIAAIAVPVPLPTFFEIPVALTLVTAGAPTGAAVAVLFAGPAVNLPSLLTVGREAGWKVSVLSGLMVWLLAVIGGVIVG